MSGSGQPGKAQTEQMFSGLASSADIAGHGRHGRKVPIRARRFGVCTACLPPVHFLCRARSCDLAVQPDLGTRQRTTSAPTAITAKLAVTNVIQDITFTEGVGGGGPG